MIHPLICIPSTQFIRMLKVIEEKNDRILFLEYELSAAIRNRDYQSRLARNFVQLSEARSGLNRYYAGEYRKNVLGINIDTPITDKEAEDYYFFHGGAELYAARVEEQKKQHGFLAVA
jgi:hypothetical protein